MHGLSSEEAHQMELEAYRMDMELSHGERDKDVCLVCGKYKVVTVWSPEGARLALGDEQFLSLPIGALKYKVCDDCQQDGW